MTGEERNVSNDGSLVFVGSTASHPSELYLLRSRDAAPVAVTDLNAAAARAPLGRVTSVTWTGPNGFAEDGVLTYPPSYVAGKKYPLVMDIHGGPISTSTWDLGGIENGVLDQLLATRGYIVFRPNYRGSDNLGEGPETSEQGFRERLHVAARDGPKQNQFEKLVIGERRGAG